MAVAAQIVVAYWIYRFIEHPIRILIPIWLVLYGSTVIIWNLTYIFSL